MLTVWVRRYHGISNLSLNPLAIRRFTCVTTPWPSFSTVCFSIAPVSPKLTPLIENSIDGSRPGPLGILPEQMTDEIWEYIFCDGQFPSPSPLPRENADALKHEYHYFYPFNIRSTGKELVPNHLTFSVYSHVALLPENKWPLSIRTNGHLLLNGEKMSKTTGNFLTIRQIIEKFGADTTRLTLADMGDGVEHVNFEEEALNANMLRVHALLAWCIVSFERLSDVRCLTFLTGHD